MRTVHGNPPIKLKKTQSPYDACGATVRDPGSTGMNLGSTGDDRDEPGTTGENRGSTGCVLPVMVEDMPNKLCLYTDRFQVSISTSKVNISLISGILYNCGTMYGT
ncbi:hypothetical protein DPMN_078542 [Dreissena polymorpha]|uniref:Uncharacterized protein n=1 Tax=Dreissena polymorpha TaxID=45954 RepID=A0A9D3YRB3_DREPO|nr:hypothetical protein DPMN_078542 [Dreissena polymorpha]